ncbi:MAG: peptidylprolyl isomerase [Desulfobacteraceae bacterium]|jgi:peptidyl-prolyl cis-trans isomerase B (cyclophilin B)
MSKLITLLVTISLWLSLTCCVALATDLPPQVLLKTDLGDIVVELNPKAAPKTVNNFLDYVSSGFYEKTIFHRVIKGFMIQGGGFTADLQRKKTKKAIENEADNGLTNKRGTIAMARTSDPHSATSQFFINVVDNNSLDFRSKTPHGWGYCVFGEVIKGLTVLSKIEETPTTTRNSMQDVPETPIRIIKASIIDPNAKKSEKVKKK